MEAELVALATAGATTLVQQLVGEGWESARTRVAEFFARRFGADEESVGAELEAVREELLSADDTEDGQAAEEARADVLAEWRARMRRGLRADPAAADELREILAELAANDTAGQARSEVSNTISGVVRHSTVIQAGTIGTIGTLRIGAAGTAGSPASPASPASPGSASEAGEAGSGSR